MLCSICSRPTYQTCYVCSNCLNDAVSGGSIYKSLYKWVTENCLIQAGPFDSNMEQQGQLIPKYYIVKLLPEDMQNLKEGKAPWRSA